MMPTIQKPERIPFITDGEKLAKAQLLAEKLAKKLNSGNFWSIGDLKKILEEALREADAITH